VQLTNAELPYSDPHRFQTAVHALGAKRPHMIEQATKDYEGELRACTANTGPDDCTDRSPARTILTYAEHYGKHLFGHPTSRDEGGTILAVVERTNTMPEHFRGAEKRKLRRRLGRDHLGRDPQDQPAQVALTANLLTPAIRSDRLWFPRQSSHELRQN